MDGENNGKPYEQMDDLGGFTTPIFGNTHSFFFSGDTGGVTQGLFCCCCHHCQHLDPLGDRFAHEASSREAFGQYLGFSKSIAGHKNRFGWKFLQM